MALASGEGDAVPAEDQARVVAPKAAELEEPEGDYQWTGSG